MIDVSIISQRERERQRLLAVGIVSELERRAWNYGEEEWVAVGYVG